MVELNVRLIGEEVDARDPAQQLLAVAARKRVADRLGLECAIRLKQALSEATRTTAFVGAGFLTLALLYSYWKQEVTKRKLSDSSKVLGGIEARS